MKKGIFIIALLGFVKAQTVWCSHPTLSKSERAENSRCFDLVISHWGEPPGDYEGNTQASQDSEYSEQDQIEAAIQYWADGIYEMTEGAHYLRTVRIFTRGINASHCDVNWLKYGIAKTVYDAPNIKSYIEFGDTFGTRSAFGNRNNWEEAGYALAHESGHKLYGLKDEYCDFRRVELTNYFRVKCSVMNDTLPAVGRNYKYLNFSTKWKGGNVTQGFADWENTKQTWQHIEYGMSCWEALTYELGADKPPTWQLWKQKGFEDKQLKFKWQRPFYKELQLVAPKGKNPPIINLDASMPLASMPSRKWLNIVWEPRVVSVIVIDRSSSMANGGLADARTSAIKLIDKAEEGDSIAVMAFDANVSMVRDFLTITNDSCRTMLRTTVLGITIGHGTAIGNATRGALNAILDYGISNSVASIYLLTDGENVQGEDPHDVIPECQQHGIIVHGLGYGPNADEALGQLARATGGTFANGLGSAMELTEAFIEANALLADRMIVAKDMGVAAATVVDIPIVIDSTLTNDFRLTVNVADGANASLALENPDGTASYAATETTEERDGSMTWDFTIAAPEQGEWRLVGTKPAGAALRYICDAKLHGRSYQVNVAALEWSDEDAALGVFASVGRDGAIDGATVTVRLELTNGVVAQVAATNFWTGMYAAAFEGEDQWLFEGAKVTVTASNPDGAAIETWQNITCGEPDPDRPLAENFMRVVSTTVVFPKLELAVGDGSGSGHYRPGDTVAIAATLPDNLFAFEYWTGDTQTVADVTAPLTTVTVTNVLSLRAVYRALTSAVTTPDYMVVDLANGGITYADMPPAGGWTSGDTYKTDKMVFRKTGAVRGEDLLSGTSFMDTQIRRVTLTKPYYIGIFEVTQGQWRTIMGSYASSNYTKSDRAVHPADKISYAAIRGSSSGAAWPSGTSVDSASFIGKLRSKCGQNFDLPTEAQWNHALRAGGLGPGLNNASAYAWTVDDSGNNTHTAGTKQPDSRGVYDMLGNVMEWCLDWYQAGLGSGTVTDPPGPSSGTDGARVLRGGAYDDEYQALPWPFPMNFMRWGSAPNTTNTKVGFRVALTMDSSETAVTVNGTRQDIAIGASLPIVAAEPEPGYVFAGWTVDPATAALGTPFNAASANTVIAVPSTAVTLTATYLWQQPEAPQEPFSDVTFEAATVQVTDIHIAPAPGGVTLSWAALTEGTSIEYAVWGKAELTDAAWDILVPEWFDALDNGNGTVSTTIPADTVNADDRPYRFFRVWAVVEK